MKVGTQERVIWVIIVLLSILVGYKFGQRIERKHILPMETQKISELDSVVSQPNRPKLDQIDKDQDAKQSLCPPPSCPPLACPPCDCKPKPKRVRKKAPPVKAISPIDRQKLLAWVKKYSPRLKRCRDAGQPIYKLHTQVTLNAEKNRILRVKIKGSNVPTQAIRCVERDLKRWPAPPQLSPTHPPLLIFGLQLD